MVGREGFALQVEVEMNYEIMEAMSAFEYLGSYCSSDGRSQKDVEIRVIEGLILFVTLKTFALSGV